jgi:uncharacterized protein YcbK (DUF882 family)
MGHSCRTWLFALLLAAAPSVASGAPKQPTEHVVQPGQTLGKIAKRYQLSIDELCEANDIKRSAKLKPGQRLALPGDDCDDEPGKTAKQPIGRADRSPASVGRGSGTKQRLGNARNASFSRYLKPATKRGFVHVLGHHGEFKGQLVGKSGKLQPKAVLALSKVLAWPRTDFVMDKRLLLMLAKLSDAFGGRMLRVVSGYRTTSFSSESKHPLGRACDFHIPGVPNSALRDYARTFNDVGVGYYPNSTFIHLDVRDYDAYWVDYSGPGEAPRRHPTAVAKRNDEAQDSRDDRRTSQTTKETESEPPTGSTGNAVDESLADAQATDSTSQHKTTTATPPAATQTAREHAGSDLGATNPPTTAPAGSAESL